MDVAKNFAKVTVFNGNYDDADTEIDILTGEGERLPLGEYNLVWWNATDYPDPADDPSVEIVRVTDRTDDTLTITRAQEATAAVDHNLPGKTYKLIAGLTARVVNEQLLGITRTGDDIEIVSDGDVIITPTGGRFEVNSGLMLRIDAATGQAALGDVDFGNSGVAVIPDDVLGHLLLRGPLATDQITSASGPVGTVVGKLAVRDAAGDIVGYLPIYGSIT